MSLTSVAPRHFVFCVALWLLAGAAWAGQYEYRLANGLRLVVKEDRRAPTVVQQVWYRAGGMDETVGVTGVAHVLEHMMFKGTRRHPGGEFERLVSEAGGRQNAFTSKDFTVYHEQVHRDRLPLVMELEADRMANLVLTEKEFAPELRVVMEERRWRYDDRPRSLLYENWMATAFSSHPYQWPVIGWMGDLQNMTWRDARDWYERWYSPGNATVVIVGDVDAKKVLALARRHYGAVRAKPVPARRTITEAPQLGARRVTVRAPAELPAVRLGYKVPQLRDVEQDREQYALDILSEILGGSEAARMHETLVRERRLATSASAAYDLVARGPSVLFFAADAAPGRTAAELEDAIRQLVARLVAEGVSEQELARAKTQNIAQEVYKRDSLFAQALQIGHLVSTGFRHDDDARILERIRQVTAAQVQAVAKKYLVDDNLTVAVLDPLPIEARKPASPPPALKH